MPKSIVFPYAITEQSKNEIKKTISFAISSKRIKYLGVNLTKEIQDLYTENYKSSWERLREIHTSGEMYHVYGLDHS